MNKFIYLGKGDTIYYVKMFDYTIVKPNQMDLYSALKTTSVKVLSEAYLDVTLDNGETIFPNINNKAHTIISHEDGVTTHRIYGVSVKAVLDAVNDSLRKRVVNIRAEVDKLKNKELNIINTMTKILETEREAENTVTTEEFASMAL